MAAGLNTAAIQIGSAAIAAVLDTVKLHTGDPGAAGTSNTTTAGSGAATFSSTSGVITLDAPVDFTGGAASGACTWVSVWDATVHYGNYQLTGDQTFNAAGEYTLDSLTITGSAS